MFSKLVMTASLTAGIRSFSEWIVIFHLKKPFLQFKGFFVFYCDLHFNCPSLYDNKGIVLLSAALIIVK